jgi:hypothetical protein
MIPAFNDFGHLPVGGHHCTWDEFHARFRFSERRTALCEKLRGIVDLARRCGFLKVMIGGSFPTAIPAPRDLDLTWIVSQNVTRETVRPECVTLLDTMAAEEEHKCSMMYVAVGDDEAKIQDWAKNLGFCAKTKRDRGTVVIDL